MNSKMWGENWMSRECDLQAFMSGTVGESINLDADCFDR